MKHNLNCEAPICAEDPNDFSGVVWHAGEVVCKASPMTKWQKKQSKINKSPARYEREDGYTMAQLEKLV